MNAPLRVGRYMADLHTGVASARMTWHNGAEVQVLSGDASRYEQAPIDDAAREIADAGGTITALRAELSRTRAQLIDETEALRSELAKARGRITPDRPAQMLGRGCVRFDERGGLWMLDGHERGWARFGFWVRDWDELFRRYNVRVTGHGTDETGPYWITEPIGEVRA